VGTFTPVYSGLLRFGLVWSGLVWFGLVWSGEGVFSTAVNAEHGRRRDIWAADQTWRD